MTLAILATLLVAPPVPSERPTGVRAEGSEVAGLQADPRIEKVERLTGNVNRPLLWAPLSVRLSSASGFKGDLVARSSHGFSVGREVDIPAGGTVKALLPAIDPVELVAGKSSLPMTGDHRSPDFLVGVDARLSYAAELVSSEKVVYQRIAAEDLPRLLASGLLEACDLLLLSEAEGLPLGAAGPWVAAPTRAEAERAVAELPRAAARIQVIHREIWNLAPQGGWVPVKRDFALFFAVVYAFAGFVALVLVSRRHARFAPVAAAGVAALSVGAYFAFFPRQHVWVEEHACEIVPTQGDAADWRVWFAGAGREVVTQVQFPRLVKPVYPDYASADLSFTIRAGDRGCTVEGLKLAPGRPVCFAGVEGRAPTMRAQPKLAAAIYRAAVRMGDRVRSLGDLPAGTDLPQTAPEEGSVPRESDAQVFLRLVEGDVLAGRLERGEQAANDVSSPDLADARRRPRYIILRLK